MPLPTLAMPPTLRLVVPPAMKLGEIPSRRITNEDHIAPLAPISTIGPTLRHMRLTPEGHTARSTSTSGNKDPGAVMEHPAIVVSDGLVRVCGDFAK
jgi:hypothetical protein